MLSKKKKTPNAGCSFAIKINTQPDTFRFSYKGGARAAVSLIIVSIPLLLHSFTDDSVPSLRQLMCGVMRDRTIIKIGFPPSKGAHSPVGELHT